MDFRDIEAKWSKRWEEAGVFEADPDERDKFYLTVAYPYPSGSMHVGHGRTYTVPDVMARFKRMQGYNVLFPMAWHVTGTPVLGVAERIQRGDKEALWLYGDLYKVPKDILRDFTKPETIVDYFSREYREIMKRMGYSIDWRRQFMTKDGQYNRFITWQYTKLNEKKLITKGKHPVKYCPNDRNPVGDHDLLTGEQAEINDFTLLKFRYDDMYLPAATLRPETVFGTTNIWLDPEGIYVKAKVDGETWVMSREASEKLKHQAKEVEIVGEVRGSEFMDKHVVTPLTGKEVPVLPATFLDPNYGTGVVFSVPAHAPFDYMALVDLQKAGYKAALSIEPITIIDIKGYESAPAREICEEMAIRDQNDDKLEEATEKIYKEEHAKGRMKEDIPEFGGISVNLAREEVRSRMLDEGSSDQMHDFSIYPVVCRCGTECVIKILEDQWFLRYSDEAWKREAHACLDGMNIVPNETKASFDHVVDWLREWACTRRMGLGTKLPWDERWLIEPLSDSTIYMSYYTISRYLRDIAPDKLDGGVFDYIYLGEGRPEDISRDKGIDLGVLKKMREEFEYWYPSEWRLSAKDLIGNHLTFHIFHHTAVVPREKWPLGIVVFGMGLLEGNKMSSSKGNVVLLGDAIEKYGADVVRLFLMGSAEPWQDFDWRENLVKSTRRQIDRFEDIARDILDTEDGGGELQALDRWLLSRFNSTIRETTEALEGFQTRKALQSAFYLLFKDMVWYLKRTKGKPRGELLKELLEKWLRLLAPFIPYTCEELWEKSGGEGFVSLTQWPEAEEAMIDREAELSEDLVKETTRDIDSILDVTGKRPKTIYIYTAPSWKWKAYESVSKVKRPDMKAVMEETMKDEELKSRGKEVAKYVGEMMKDPSKLRFEIEIDEFRALNEAREFLERGFNAKVEVHRAEASVYDPMRKMGLAAPMKPAIYIE
ncbi:MAG: leucine--tRNA ligase [Candidatus Hydrothermarchaeaceae archaeon]